MTSFWHPVDKGRNGPDNSGNIVSAMEAEGIADLLDIGEMYTVYCLHGSDNCGPEVVVILFGYQLSDNGCV